MEKNILKSKKNNLEPKQNLPPYTMVCTIIPILSQIAPFISHTGITEFFN